MTFYIAELETRHFTFHGAGNTEAQAMRALRAALRRCKADPSLAADASMRAYTAGAGYRDNEPVTQRRS